MARIGLGALIRDIELAVFDKDGTLIDFHHLWSRKARLAVEAVVTSSGGDRGLANHLYHSIGFDLQTGQAAANGPLAVTSMAKLYTICATVLYQHGLAWHEAERVTEAHFAGGLGALPTVDLVKPVGDVVGLFRRLADAGVKIAIVTSDDRAATVATLPVLGIETYVAGMVCGDDPVANKPAPDALLRLGRELAVPLGRIMMVGDTLGDMMMAANAGIGCRVAVLSGAGGTAELTPHADAVLDSIGDIRVLV
jgi:phosphoglycolate phosphatase-like HAD superfamily hydrolase